jgi:hypothetical protein
MNAILASAEQNGINWIVFLCGLWLLKVVLDKQYKSFRDDQERVHRFFERSANAIDRFAKEIANGQSVIMVRIEDANKSSADKILGAIGEMTSANNAATGAIIFSLQARENRTVEAIERLLIALREDLATLRPAPPKGDTGSAVRDSGVKP